MKSTKLIKVIERLSKADLKRFKEFVYSPFFRAGKTEQDLFDFIYKYAPDFTHKKFTSEAAATHVFTGGKYDNTALTKAQSRLFKLLELFIYYSIKNNDLSDMESVLMKFYDTENLSAQVESTYKKNQKKQATFQHRDLAYYYNQLVVEKQYSIFLGRKFEDNRGDGHLQKVIITLDVFYLREKLLQMCEILNRKERIKVTYEVILMDEILAFLKDSSYRQIPIIAIWYTAFLLLNSTEKNEYYHQLNDLLNTHGKLLDDTDKRVLYTYLENSTNMVFSGDAYYEALWELYSTQLENEVIYIEGYLSPTIFKNIVTVALRLGHLDWTEAFLEKNKGKIVPEYEGREDVYSYSMAQLYFKQKKNDDVLSLLNQTVFNDIYTKMDVRRMYMKVYYEMEYSDMFEDMVNSFRSFLHENQHIPALHIQAHRDFVNTAYNIYRTIKKETERIEKITEQIAEIQILPEKTWLLEKLEALG